MAQANSGRECRRGAQAVRATNWRPVCLRLPPIPGDPGDGQVDVQLTEHHEYNRRSIPRRRLLRDEGLHRPDLVVVMVFLACRLRLGIVRVMVRMRRCVRVDERVPVRVMLVAHRVDIVMRVRVRCCRKPAEEGQQRNDRAQTTTQHDPSMVRGALRPCQARTACSPCSAAHVQLRLSDCSRAPSRPRPSGRWPARRHIGATGRTTTSENDQGLALSTNRPRSVMLPAFGRPVAT